MTASPVPPLPGPVEDAEQDHSPENRREMSRRFISQARNEMAAGNRLQAGEKAWGAFAQLMKMVGEQRGWRHTSHRQVDSIGRHILAEYAKSEKDLVTLELTLAIADAHKGHVNFYENRYAQDQIEDLVRKVDREWPALERLATEAAQSPLPFEIKTTEQRNLLRAVTSNNKLQVGDRSAVGFSKRHSPGSGDDGQGGVPATPPSPDPNPRPSNDTGLTVAESDGGQERNETTRRRVIPKARTAEGGVRSAGQFGAGAARKSRRKPVVPNLVPKPPKQSGKNNRNKGKSHLPMTRGMVTWRKR